MTTMYFPEKVLVQLKQLARRQGKPMSELVRVYVDQGIKRERRRAPKVHFLDKLVGYKLKLGGKLDAREIDRIVYKI